MIILQNLIIKTYWRHYWKSIFKKKKAKEPLDWLSLRITCHRYLRPVRRIVRRQVIPAFVSCVILAARRFRFRHGHDEIWVITVRRTSGFLWIITFFRALLIAVKRLDGGIEIKSSAAAHSNTAIRPVTTWWMPCSSTLAKVRRSES
jgi:hypothetical protein